MTDTRWMFLFTAALVAAVVLFALSYIHPALRLEVGLAGVVAIVVIGYLGEQVSK